MFTRNEDGTCDGVSIGPNGVVDMGKQLTDGEAYHGAVDDNKERLGVTGGGSEPGAVRRRRDAPVCPECRTAHNGECL